MRAFRFLVVLPLFVAFGLAGLSANLAGQASEPSVKWIEDEPRIRVAEAAPASPRGSILLLHDWFGLSDMVVESVGRLAGEGYRVIALDLYDGTTAANQQEAQALMGALRPDEVRARIEHALSLFPDGDPPAVLGFSMGGAPAMQTATESNDITRAIVVYGGGVEEFVPAGTRDRILLITGAEDQWAMGSVRALVNRADPAPVELMLIPGADHGYAQPLFAGGANLDVEATEATWQAILAFLERTR